MTKTEMRILTKIAGKTGLDRVRNTVIRVACGPVVGVTGEEEL